MPMSRRFALLRRLPVRYAPVLAAAAAMAVLAMGAGEAVAQRGGGGGGMGGGAGHIPMPVMGPSSGSFGRGSVNVPTGRGGPTGIGRRGGNRPFGRPVVSGGCESGRGGRGCRQPVSTSDRPFYPRPGGPVFVGRPPAVDGPVYDAAPRPVLRTRRASVTPSNQRVIRSEQSTPRVTQTTRRVTQAAPLSRRIAPPPGGESRFVPDQIVCVLRGDISERGIDRFLRDHRLARTDNGNRRLALLNGRVFRYRITDARPVSAVVAGLRGDQRVITAQPNYLYELAQSGDVSSQLPAPADPASVDLSVARSKQAASAGQSAASGSQQYAVSKLQLPKAHEIARGERVLVAVIDSGIDATHPELAGAIAKTIDVVQDGNTQPHTHGTAMAGAIAAKAQLTGVAPGAQVIAVRAFSAQGGGASSTSYQLASAVDSAVTEGARVINLSFAGPADPLLSEALKRARAKNIVLVAAAGNAGPNSPPLYPGADPSVIAVTATDENDKVYAGANRGRHIVVAAPGVDILVPEPRGSYGLTTGTSVAAAHVSGVAALLIARNPSLGPEAVKQILRRSAQSLGQIAPEDAGVGLADAFSAVSAADQRSAPAGAAAGRRRP